MKNEKLLEKIGEISEEYIIAAVPAKKKRPWVKWTALAACFGLVIFAATRLIPMLEPMPGLPMLTITEALGEGRGFEGYMAYDISELVNGNPWAKARDLSTLPVFQNLAAYNEYDQVPGADLDQMEEFLLTVASRLGIDIDAVEVTDDTPDKAAQDEITQKFAMSGQSVPEGYFSPRKVMLEDKGIRVEVDDQMTAEIWFAPAVALPGQYNFAGDATYAEIAAVAEYLKEEYKDLLGMENPQVNIYGGDYGISGGQTYQIEFYEGSGDIAGQIINYNFYRVAFYGDGNGKLFLARVFRPDLSQKVGDYPIMTVNKAKRLLADGHYITTVSEEMPGLAYVAKVELVYRNGGREKYFMPYYRFYVELPDMETDAGLKTYGAYYVPAIEDAYISNMPVWDGSFN